MATACPKTRAERCQLRARTVKAVTPARPMPLLLLLVLLAGLAGLGGYLAIAQINPPGLDGAPASYRQMSTSFGQVTVSVLANSVGMTSGELGGMVHNLQGYVEPDRVQLQVWVTLQNRLGHSVLYYPAQFRLVGAGDDLALPIGSSLGPGRLLPAASVSGSLSFVAPRGPEELWVEYRDPGSSTPVRVSIGRAAYLAAPDPDGPGPVIYGSAVPLPPELLNSQDDHGHQRP